MDKQLSFESLCVWVSIYIMFMMWSAMFTAHAQGANGMRECIGDVEQIADDV